MIDERAREVNRIQKVLEGANIKLSSVASDVLGKTGRAMLEAMIQGQENPVALSELAKGRLKSKKADLQKAMHGLMETPLLTSLNSGCIRTFLMWWTSLAGVNLSASKQS